MDTMASHDIVQACSGVACMSCDWALLQLDSPDSSSAIVGS
jgi:hypothetical protein